MKKTILTLLITIGIYHFSVAQIQYTGCTGSIAAGYPFTLNLTGNDGTHNIYTSALPGPSCSAGVCAFRVIWTGSQWEIQLSNNGGSSFDFILYYNTTNAIPNPPDLTLGTWVGQNPCSGQPIDVFSGDVQSSPTLSLNTFETKQEIKLSPNPTTNVIEISGFITKESYTIYNVLGVKVLKGSISNNQQIEVSNLTNGLYFLKFENGYTIKFLKK